MSALRMTPTPHREHSEAERASAWFCWISQIVFVSPPFLDFVSRRSVFRSSGLNVFYFVCRRGKHIHSAAACAGSIKWKLTGYSMELWLLFVFFRLFCQLARCSLTGVAASLTLVGSLCNALGLTCWNLINCLERLNRAFVRARHILGMFAHKRPIQYKLQLHKLFKICRAGTPAGVFVGEKIATPS